MSVVDRFYCPYCPGEPQMSEVEPGRFRCPDCGRERDGGEMVPGRLCDPCPGCGHAVTVEDPCSCDYETWLSRQHKWMFGRMGVAAEDPLAVAVAALDRIARMQINGRGNDKYCAARIALEKVGAWPRDVG